MRSPVSALLRNAACSHAATARITRTGNAWLVSSYVAGNRLEQTLAGHPRTAPSPFAPEDWRADFPRGAARTASAGDDAYAAHAHDQQSQGCGLADAALHHRWDVRILFSAT